MSDTYLSSPIKLEDFRHWKWLKENDLRISFDENSGKQGFYDEIFTIWSGLKGVMVYVKSGYVMGFRVGGNSNNYEVIDIIKDHFKNEIESVNYILERYESEILGTKD